MMYMNTSLTCNKLSPLSYVLDGFFDTDDKAAELSFRWTCQNVNLRDSPSNRTTPLLLIYTVNRVANMSDNTGETQQIQTFHCSVLNISTQF